MTKTVLYTLLLLLSFSLPFEIIHPILILPWVEFTNLELLVMATVAIWLVYALRRYAPNLRPGSKWERMAPQWLELGRRSRVNSGGNLPAVSTREDPATSLPWVLHRNMLVWLPVLFLTLTVLSAALAPVHRLDALKFVTRTAMGLAVFWLLIDTVRSRAYLVSLLWAMVLGAGVSALLGLGEALAWSPLAPLLLLFKEAPTRVGGELRVSASFQYATMAAIFFEMTVPLAVALAATAQTRVSRWMAAGIALLGTANVVLTLSRAGMVTLTGVLAIMLVLAWRQLRFRPLAPPALLALGTLAAVTGALAWQAETFRTRLVTENDLGWYGASYIAPPSLHLAAGEPTTVTVTVQNTGTVGWHATGENPFVLGYYWLSDDGQALQQGHVEVPLPRSVAPGETIHVPVPLHPKLPSGNYQLAWGMLQHNILWFRHRNVPDVHTAVHIEEGTGTPSTPPETTEGLPGGETLALPPTVGRLDLWRAAVRMWTERPLLGVGPDNFRHLYGRYLNLSDWDRRLHANNLYLELLAGWGLAGTLAFAGLMLGIAHRWLRLWRAATGAVAIKSLALGGSFLAFFVHGLLDYFLEFVPLYLLFWTVAALIVATEHMAVKVDQ